MEMRYLSIEGNITIFKALAISKRVHLGLITSVPAFIIDQPNIIKKSFIWQEKKPKIKQSTLRNTFELSGLKDTDIFYKVTSLQCSWVRRLFMSEK